MLTLHTIYSIALCVVHGVVMVDDGDTCPVNGKVRITCTIEDMHPGDRPRGAELTNGIDVPYNVPFNEGIGVYDHYTVVERSLTRLVVVFWVPVAFVSDHTITCKNTGMDEDTASVTGQIRGNYMAVL